MIERESQIKELYDLKHRNDNEIHTHFDYETNFIRKSFSKYIYRNDKMYNFLEYMRLLFVWMIESTLPIRNLYNYTCSKYYNRYSN
jgi:hypothetical protein